MEQEQPSQKAPKTPPYMKPAPGWPIHPALVTAGLQIPGFKIIYLLGIVRGLTVRSAGFGGGIAAAFESLSSGNVQTMINMCERAREEAFFIMLQHAAQIGANAIISFQYDTTEVGEGLTEVLAYGTAVWAEPISS